MKNTKKSNPVLKSSKSLIIAITVAAFLGLSFLTSACETNENGGGKKDLKKLEKLIAKAYLNFDIQQMMSPDFLAAQETSVKGEEFCIDWDFFYNTQEDVSFANKPKVRTEAIDDSHVNAFVILDYKDWGDPVIMQLIMVKDESTGQWLVDDVIQEGSETSIKQMMIECANEQ